MTDQQQGPRTAWSNDDVQVVDADKELKENNMFERMG